MRTLRIREKRVSAEIINFDWFFLNSSFSCWAMMGDDGGGDVLIPTRCEMEHEFPGSIFKTKKNWDSAS